MPVRTSSGMPLTAHTAHCSIARPPSAWKIGMNEPVRMNVRWYASHALPSAPRCRFSSMRLGGRPGSGAALRAAGGGASDDRSPLAPTDGTADACTGEGCGGIAWNPSG